MYFFFHQNAYCSDVYVPLCVYIDMLSCMWGEIYVYMYTHTHAQCQPIKWAS